MKFLLRLLVLLALLLPTKTLAQPYYGPPIIAMPYKRFLLGVNTVPMIATDFTSKRMSLGLGAQVGFKPTPNLSLLAEGEFHPWVTKELAETGVYGNLAFKYVPLIDLRRTSPFIKFSPGIYFLRQEVEAAVSQNLFINLAVSGGLDVPITPWLLFEWALKVGANLRVTRDETFIDINSPNFSHIVIGTNVGVLFTL